MDIRILQVGHFTPPMEAALAAEFDVHPLWKEADTGAFLAHRGHEFAALTTTGLIGADTALIESLPALKVIALRGVGCDKIDLDTARRRGVAVSNTPGVLTDCVADTAFAMILCAGRNLCTADRFVRRGAWVQGRFPMGTRVSGKRLGIVGLGRIGQAVAQRAAGFDMHVRYYGTRRNPEVSHVYEQSLLELARWADFLVITAAGGPGTYHLVSADVIAALGPEGFLVNAARGSIVDEAALVDALVHRRIAGAALDVFENEPHVPDALLGLDNVVLLPHMASSTTETFKAMEDLVLENLRSFFRNGRLITPVL
ncbi:MAG: 2-hydroxyacid dehydrogenase [Rhodocyclaceae bacterium]|nr:2-hydroxyacid dehydrogenase [Rhodocyclaceae bacterium]MBX3667744.1 2-hydroxyacid dehydrogenase [Rhodocyclaceae bacterium]